MRPLPPLPSVRRSLSPSLDRYLTGECTLHYEPAEALPDFPVSTFDGDCPECGGPDTVQVIDRPTRFWNGARVIDGVFCVDGHYDVTDDGDDGQVSCWSCGAAWALPADVQYL